MKTVKSIQKIKIWICMAFFLLLLMAFGSRVLAERSGMDAAREMSEEAMLFQALLIGADVLVLSILVTVLVVMIKKRKDKKKIAEKTDC